jgi:hypothetical protein
LLAAQPRRAKECGPRYADIDSGVAVAVMRNRIVGDVSAAAAIDQMVADHLG